MKFNKRILLFSSMSITGLLTTLSVYSCKFNETNNKNIKTLQILKEDKLETNPYFLDYSTVMKTNIDSDNILQSSVAAQLFRIITVKSPEYEKNSSYKLKSSGIYAYKFELAEKIIIETINGTEIEFNNDDFELIDSNAEIYEKAISSNPKSINSRAFIHAMNNAKKMKIKIKDNVHWVDSSGEKTKYTINAKDFWFSYLRSYYNGFFQRSFTNQNGDYRTSILIDLENKKRLNDLSNQRFGTNLFTNNQQFEIHGISSSKFIEFADNLEPKNAVQDNFLIFEEDEDYAEVKNFMGFFDLMLVNSLIFSPAPSDFIKEESKTLNQTFNKNDKEIPLYGYGIIKEIGLYFYGVNGWKQNLYAGPYIPNKNASDTNKLVLTKNKYYYDKNFVNSKENIERIELKYSQTDPILNFNKIKNDNNTLVNLLSLTQEQQKYFNSNTKDYKFVPYKKYNKTSSVGNNAFNITPKPDELVNVNSSSILNSIDYNSIAFNDNFSKIVYGSSIKELKQGYRGQFDNKLSISSGVFENNSISFRSIINASINWNYVKDSLNLSSDLWITNAAPDAKIGGMNQNTSKFKTLREAKEIVNDLIVIDNEGQKIELNKQNSNQLKSSSFNILQKHMKKLLDQLFNNKSLGLNKSENITWIIYNNRLLNQNELKMYEQIIEVIKEIDPRLNPIFNYLPTQVEIDKVYGTSNGTGNNSTYQFITYSYEKDSLAPYLDKITHAIGMSPFALWYKFSNLKANDILAINFPEITRFSKIMKEKFEEGFLKLNEIYTKDNDGNLFRKIKWDDLNKFNSYEERNLYLRGILKTNENNQTGYSNYGFGGLGYLWDNNKKIFKIDNIIEQAKFANYYLTISTNEQLIELIRELNTFRSFGIDLDKKIDSINFLDYKIVNKNWVYNIPYNDVIYVQDIKIK
ncbi:hypothetical protein HUN03_00579 [Mycoplasmopsis anatis]|uniref:OppA family ABC transporter substrate-binding lipoprotein n=1 Tax=Mycoplasmopsis anatis TaxID=171279 RepID=UPI001C4E1E8F|nr:hypothetical protein [Mycoplasmopsis anatis]MBW0594415.1 hypothetical protein [Mycoplasmopsis anatis]MBW0595269.1 hypothetical protein [Mycoplasmopsis anatis]MBW0596309.1 hypothetical protein [Mycoplasmopsis anatis]MBW0597808.1 hypothetical protein [Mycoplasmopsis anatis]MBW0598013.1 hypothetical protein [Mycoplasmopsis anatis]